MIQIRFLIIVLIISILSLASVSGYKLSIEEDNTNIYDISESFDILERDVQVQIEVSLDYSVTNGESLILKFHPYESAYNGRPKQFQ